MNALIANKANEGLTEEDSDNVLSAVLEWLFTCIPPYGLEMYCAALDWLGPHMDAAMTRTFTRFDLTAVPLSPALKATTESHNFLLLGATVIGRPEPEAHVENDFMCMRRRRMSDRCRSALEPRWTALSESGAPHGV